MIEPGDTVIKVMANYDAPYLVTEILDKGRVRAQSLSSARNGIIRGHNLVKAEPGWVYPKVFEVGERVVLDACPSTWGESKWRSGVVIDKDDEYVTIEYSNGHREEFFLYHRLWVMRKVDDVHRDEEKPKNGRAEFVRDVG